MQMPCKAVGIRNNNMNNFNTINCIKITKKKNYLKNYKQRRLNCRLHRYLYYVWQKLVSSGSQPKPGFRIFGDRTIMQATRQHSGKTSKSEIFTSNNNNWTPGRRRKCQRYPVSSTFLLLSASAVFGKGCCPTPYEILLFGISDSNIESPLKCFHCENFTFSNWGFFWR